MYVLYPRGWVLNMEWWTLNYCRLLHIAYCIVYTNTIVIDDENARAGSDIPEREQRTFVHVYVASDSCVCVLSAVCV